MISNRADSKLTCMNIAAHVLRSHLPMLPFHQRLPLQGLQEGTRIARFCELPTKELSISRLHLDGISEALETFDDDLAPVRPAVLSLEVERQDEGDNDDQGVASECCVHTGTIHRRILATEDK